MWWNYNIHCIDQESSTQQGFKTHFIKLCDLHTAGQKTSKLAFVGLLVQSFSSCVRTPQETVLHLLCTQKVKLTLPEEIPKTGFWEVVEKEEDVTIIVRRR